MTTSEVRELIMIGSGPAGYTAAVYAARGRCGRWCSRARSSADPDDHHGGGEPRASPTASAPAHEADARPAIRFERTELRSEDVEEVSLTGPVKTVTAHGRTYRARAVILAMGAAARYLDVPGEQQLLGRGVSACATCDGFFFRDQDIAVVGGGDSAMEEATFLTRFARSSRSSTAATTSAPRRS